MNPITKKKTKRYTTTYKNILTKSFMCDHKFNKFCEMIIDQRSQVTHLKTTTTTYSVFYNNRLTRTFSLTLKI